MHNLSEGRKEESRRMGKEEKKESGKRIAEKSEKNGKSKQIFHFCLKK